MTLLKDLIAIHTPTAQQIAEAGNRRGGDIAKLIEKWQEANNAWHFEGQRGVRTLEKLVRVLGYRQGMDEFLEDNSGALGAIVEWIGSQRSPEWTEALKNELSGEDEDGDDE